MNYEALDAYKSYDLQWLGPIVYPLSFAVVAQALVFYDMLRRTCCADRAAATRWLVPQSARLNGAAAPPDARVSLLVIMVMLSETTFAVLCLVQCSINFITRSFPGGRAACDFQAFYATYYTFSSVGTFELAVLFGARAAISGGNCSLFRMPIIAGAGVAVHGGALLIAALPLFGAGEYLFATDYCQYNAEGTFAPLVFAWLIAGLLITAGSAVAVGLAKRSPSSSASSPASSTTSSSAAAAIATDADADAPSSCRTAQQAEQCAKRRAEVGRLFAACALYYAAAWLTTLVLLCLHWSNGSVFDSPQWRVYGAQALILHSNQLVIPLLIGCWYRHLLNAILASHGEGDVAIDDTKQIKLAS